MLMNCTAATPTYRYKVKIDELYSSYTHLQIQSQCWWTVQLLSYGTYRYKVNVDELYSSYTHLQIQSQCWWTVQLLSYGTYRYKVNIDELYSCYTHLQIQSQCWWTVQLLSYGTFSCPLLSVVDTHLYWTQARTLSLSYPLYDPVYTQTSASKAKNKVIYLLFL